MMTVDVVVVPSVALSLERHAEERDRSLPGFVPSCSTICAGSNDCPTKRTALAPLTVRRTNRPNMRDSERRKRLSLLWPFRVCQYKKRLRETLLRYRWRHLAGFMHQQESSTLFGRVDFLRAAKRANGAVPHLLARE